MAIGYEFNEFIDFEGIFDKVFKQSKEDLLKYQYESEIEMNILSFKDEMSDYVLYKDECELDMFYTFFYFMSHEHIVTIKYDSLIDEFVTFEKEKKHGV